MVSNLRNQLAGILSPLPRKVIPDFAIDNSLRVQKLDQYCKVRK
jgi:hypothetical protein